MAMSLKFNVFVSYRLQLVCLNLTERRKSYLTDHGYTLLGFSPVRAAELRVEDWDLEVDERVSSYGLTSPDVVPLKNVVTCTSWIGAREVRIKTLGEAVPFLLKPLKPVAESGSDVLLESEKTRKWFAILISYCCYVLEASEMSAVPHCAEK